MKISSRTTTGIVLSLAFVACSEPTASRPGVGTESGPGFNAASLNSDKMAELRRYSEGACAVSTIDRSGAAHGFAMPRQDLPFAVAPVQHDAKTGRGNGRVVQISLNRPSGAVALNCWVPSTVTAVELLQTVHASRSGPWSPIFSGVTHAGIIPDSAHRSPLSDEARAFEAEMLVSRSAKPSTTTSVHGASLNTGCDDVNGTFYYWDGSSWVFIEVDVSVCDDTYGDFLGWIIDNGYANPPSISVDASNYEITDLDSVTFTARIGGGTYPRLGWTWVPEAGTSWDPWTTACTGNNLTCRIQVHGTGKMYFTIATPSGNLPGGMGITGDAAPDIGLDDDNGDAPSSADSTTGPTNTIDLTAHEDSGVYSAAVASGEWLYTQGCAHCSVPHGTDTSQVNAEELVNYSIRRGDCTDLAQYAHQTYLGLTAWPFEKMSTSQYNSWSATALAKHGFTQLTDSNQVRYGDVVVRTAHNGSGHAGLFTGWQAHWEAQAWANNGSPAYSDKQRKDKKTGTWTAARATGYDVKFFRARKVVP
jgi:hypothetical protein